MTRNPSIEGAEIPRLPKLYSPGGLTAIGLFSFFGGRGATAADPHSDVSRVKPTTVKGKLNDGLPRSLVQPSSAESFQIVLAVRVLPHGQIFCDPGERDIGLRAA